MVIDLNGDLRVLFASNGNEASLFAAETIRELLLPMIGQLELLTVAPLGGMPARLTRTSVDERAAELETATEAVIYTLGHITEPDSSISVRVRWGVPYSEILTKAAECRPDLIVLGGGGRHAIRALLTAGTTLNVLARSRHPVLVARAQDENHTGVVAIPCFSPAGLAASVEWLHRLSFPRGVRVVLGAALAPIPAVPGMLLSLREHVQSTQRTFRQTHLSLLETLLERTAGDLRISGYEVITEICGGSEQQLLASLAGDFGAGMVILGLPPSLQPSVTTPLLRAIDRLPCSVLVTRGA